MTGKVLMKVNDCMGKMSSGDFEHSRALIVAYLQQDNAARTQETGSRRQQPAQVIQARRPAEQRSGGLVHAHLGRKARAVAREVAAKHAAAARDEGDASGK